MCGHQTADRDKICDSLKRNQRPWSGKLRRRNTFTRRKHRLPVTLLRSSAFRPNFLQLTGTTKLIFWKGRTLCILGRSEDNKIKAHCRLSLLSASEVGRMGKKTKENYMQLNSTPFPLTNKQFQLKPSLWGEDVGFDKDTSRESREIQQFSYPNNSPSLLSLSKRRHPGSLLRKAKRKSCCW